MKLIPFILAIVLSSTLAAEESAVQRLPTTFITTHFDFDLSIGFGLPSVPAKSYFINPIVAVRIESVRCDGIEIVGMPFSPGDIDCNLNFFQPVVPQTMIYRMDSRQFFTLKSLDQLTGHAVLERYEIPVDSKRVEIEYRIRFPGNKTSEVLKLISVVSSDFQPNQSAKPTQASGPRG